MRQTRQPNNVVADLEARFAKLCQQADGLLAARSAMLARERLLSAWCSGFQLLKDLGCTSSSSDEQEWHRLQELELELSQQMTQLPSVSVDDSTELLPAAGIHGTIAPAADPIAYFRRLMSLPLLPAATTMSTYDLGCLLREATMEAGAQQHQLQMTPPSLHGPIILKMQQAWDRYFHAVISLHLVGRAGVFVALPVFNLETLQPDPEGAMQYEKALIERIPFLQLTPQQQEAITVGTGMHEARMRSIFMKRQPGCSSSQSRPGAATVAGSGSETLSCPSPNSSSTGSGLAFGDGNHRSSSCSSGSGGSSESGGASLDTLRSRQLQRQATEDEVSRWELVLQEETLLRLTTLGWLVGSLSWPQMTTLGTVCWPYPHRPVVFAKAVQAQWQEQEAHQQQRLAGLLAP